MNVERYQFRTRGELDAFMHGVGEALLRIEYTVVDRNGQEIPADVDPVQVFAPTLVAVDE